MKLTKAEALGLIRSNPGATAILDNDSWHVEKPKPEGFPEMAPRDQEAWYDQATLLSSHDVPGCDYGGGLIEILALYFELNCESA